MQWQVSHVAASCMTHEEYISLIVCHVNNHIPTALALTYKNTEVLWAKHKTNVILPSIFLPQDA